MDQVSETQHGYDQVADQYAEKFLHELDHKPRDRELLDRFAARVAGKGRVADIGTGPGQVAVYLAGRGVDALGIDLSPEMVRLAQEANPQVEFRQGDMRALSLEDGELAGITAFYSIIHIPREEVPDVLREFRRVLQPGGLLLLSFHEGDEVRHFDEWWGKKVSLDFLFFWRDEMVGYLRDAGFDIDEVYDRDPDPEYEVETHRVYIFASKPSDE